MNEDDRLNALTAAVLAGTPVDWDAVESAATDADRRVIGQLRVLAEIGRLAREDARPGSPVLPERPEDLGDAAVDRTASRWGPLRILDKVAEGSSAVVYRAWDVRLDREVALKLRPDVRPDATGLSFIEEGRLLARVRDPHVVSIYGADAADGHVGVWMELVHGRTLDAIVRERGPLAPRDAALIGVDLCQALSAVHRAGVLHRDVKAQNVMREDDGRVVLMDLGIGHEIDAASASDGSGTPVYMAPELFGQAPASVRSDLYSLGVLLYYLVTGAFPVAGRTVDEIREAHREGRRTRLRDVRPDLPAPFVAVIERATAPDVAGRFASAAEMGAALLGTIAKAQPGLGGLGGLVARRPILTLLVAAAGILVAAGVLLVRGVTRPPADAPAPAADESGATGPGAWSFEAHDWLLITAFDNQTGNSTLDGTIEYAFERELGTSGTVSVVTPERVNDALQLMKQPPSTRVTRAVGLEIAARDSGIRALLTGRLERLGNRYVLSVSVIDPGATGRPVMAASLDADDEERLLPAVGRLSADILSALDASRRPAPGGGRQLERATTPSLVALQFYSQAVRAASVDQPEASLALARRATAADPTFASAHAWTAFMLSKLNHRPVPDAGMREQMLAAADSAMEFIDTATDREQMFIRALALRLRGQRDQAIGEYEALLRAYPDDYWAAEQMLGIYGSMHAADRIVRFTARAADLRPNSLRANLNAAWAHIAYSGNVAGAQPYLARARALTPDDGEPNEWLRFEPVFEDWLRGDVASAAARLETAAASHESSEVWFLYLAGMNLALGRLREAERALDRMEGARQDLPRWREDKRLAIALARDDRAAVRAWVDRALRAEVGSGPPGPIWAYVRFGSPEDVDRRVDAWTAFLQGQGSGGEPNTGWAAGEIALARGHVDEAVTRLRSAWRTMPLGHASALIAAASCAEALARRGDVDQAVEELEVASRDKGRLYQGIGSTIPEWIRARRQLAALYRQLGRHEDAERVSVEVRTLLSHADPDYVIE